MRLPENAKARLAIKVLLGVALVIVLGSILIDLESSTRDWDAYGELVGAQRAALTHQPFYVGATDQKGPLWLSVYSIAYYLVGMRDAWWIIAAMTMLMAVGVSYSAFRYALTDGRDRLFAGAAAATVFIGLTLNQSVYGHILYSRNIVSLLFAGAFAMIAVTFTRKDRSKRSTWLMLAGAGVLTGLGVQTNIASAPTAVVFGVLVGWLAWRAERPRLKDAAIGLAIFAGAAILALLSALVWYQLRGAGPDFREFWWNYNRRYVSGTGISTMQSLRKGPHDFYRYYLDHPLLALIIGGFIVDGVRRARAGVATAFDAAIVGWWLAECLAVTLAQRFFDQYLVLPLVPVAFMGVTLAARYGSLVAPWARPAAAITIVLASLFITAGRQVALDDTDVLVYARPFHSPTPTAIANAYQHRMRPDLQRLKKAVDKYSNKGDWVFAWTGQPETYYAIDRPEATRFGVNQWLWGVIPQGDIGPQYVPRDAWKNFGKDFIDTPPELWIEQPKFYPLPSYLPLIKIRDCAFKLVTASSEQRIYKRVKPIGPCIKAADLPAVDAADEAARGAG
jgi:hypothetical protein